MAPTLPESYTSLSLPDVRLSHHPATSPTVTPIVVVYLNRPQARNAFTPAMSASLVTAFDLFSRDDRVRCVVLTGSDPANRTFCAGMDLSQDRGGSENAQEFDVGNRASYRDLGGVTTLAIYNCNKPVIMAMNGSAVGVGITTALGANIRVISEDAKVGFVFARRGLVMEACSSFFLPRLIGTSKALHLTTTGAVYAATDPLVRDLFGEVVPPDQVLPRALALAADVAARTSGVSTRMMKDMMYRGGETPEEAHALESKVIFDLFRSADFVEGVLSFKQRREPEFKGTLEEDAPVVWPWWEWKQIREKAKI